MKIKLFICISLLFILIDGRAAVTAERRVIEMKAKIMTRPRSLSIIPVNVFLENTAIALEFIYPCESVTIEIINTDNGYSVYYNAMENPGNFVINMTGEESGYYRLELVIDGKRYSGEFWLE
ncbi:DUF3244 domain-containing protein [Bacteroides sp. OttesenSCG-928-E20]|nr:DUF3244 domain-containing protein [Bacteroides sp. OttesenSCG-928-E20]